MMCTQRYDIDVVGQSSLFLRTTLELVVLPLRNKLPFIVSPLRVMLLVAYHDCHVYSGDGGYRDGSVTLHTYMHVVCRYLHNFL